MESVRHRYGFSFRINVSAEGSKEGVCVAWIKDLSILLWGSAKNLIDVSIKDFDRNPIWGFTGFYETLFV